MKKNEAFAKDLLAFIEASPTPVHAVETAIKRLEKAGFKEFSISKNKNLAKGEKYYIKQYNTALFAFVVGNDEPSESGFRVVGTHVDSPCFRVKSAPEIIAEESYIKLNTEVYGGPILSTWMDRPLSMAGSVALRGKTPLKPLIKSIDFRRPTAVIPNLAIHMNRDVNDGVKLNRQVDMLPLIGLTNGANFNKKGFFVELLAEEIKVKPAEILDYDLFLYDPAPGCLVGVKQEFISAPRLDNLASTHAALEAIAASRPSRATAVLAAFDNEEVGSSTKQGADSPALEHVLESIVYALGGDREDYFKALAATFMISADAAHAAHPNKGEKCDLTNRPLLNGGPVIKTAASQSYTTDAYSGAVFAALCEAAGVPVQRFLNRSDERGGSTIGPISSTHLPVRSVDVGMPLLGMHSVRELTGVEDPICFTKALTEFYKS